jgi:hypothetical protein
LEVVHLGDRLQDFGSLAHLMPCDSLAPWLRSERPLVRRPDLVIAGRAPDDHVAVVRMHYEETLLLVVVVEAAAL